MEVFAAHIRREEDGSQTVQTVQEHNAGAGEIARSCLDSVGLGNLAWLAGNYHDIGKLTEEYQIYLKDAVAGKPVRRGSVIHTFTGVRLFLETFHGEGKSLYEKLASELIAYAIGSHHGLFDCVSIDGVSGFQHRLELDDCKYNEAIENMHMDDAGRVALEEDFQRAVSEVTQVVEKLLAQFFTHPFKDADRELTFYYGMLARLLSSAVIEGDCLNTSCFNNHIAEPPLPPHDMRPIWEARLKHVEDKLRLLPSDSVISRARAEISQACLAAADSTNKVFRLNVPTGAGKTLSSLRFALAYAAKQNCSRIIIAAPLLSIINQNAGDLREYIGDDSLILEHHSNVVRKDAANEEEDSAALLEPNNAEFLKETWSAPFIITTLVQLLNTMFSGKKASVRRFHSLCRSVIIIDEVQSVPLKFLSLFNSAINFLSGVCGATVVLCSATQPCLEETPHALRVPAEDMVPYSEALWAPFRRTCLKDGGKRKLCDFPALVEEELEHASRLLIICNKKDEARNLYRALCKGPWQCEHLSAAMCPAHRNAVIGRIKGYKKQRKLVCVSTQVIEAGVNVSFDCVIRFTAGLDNAVQAAGRCNRNRESDNVRPVYMVNCTDEDLTRLSEIQLAKTAALGLMESYRRAPQQYENDLSGRQAVHRYYELLYESLPEKYQDGIVNGQNLYYLFSVHHRAQGSPDDVYILRQALMKGGELFKVFDDDTTSVLVPYGKGKEAIQKLSSSRTEYDLEYTKKILEEAKPFFVNLYSYQMQALQSKGALRQDTWGRVWILDAAYYDDAVGFSVDDPQNKFLEV